ncbi:MAG: hypothetical protein HY239_16075 [Mycolicibacterium aromaticivorans]|nr:hypothetical protein [Mycolicibacterium aromaticivorans]
MSQLGPDSGAAWAQCDDLVGTIGATVDCTVLAAQEKHVFTLTVNAVDDGRVSYEIAQKS